MIKVIKKNNIFFIVAAVVLICGAFMAGLLLGSTNAAKATQQIKTAQAEASEQAVFTAETPGPSESGYSDAASSLSAEALQSLVSSRVNRRESIIPVIDTVVITDAKTWKEVTPENSESIKAAAYEKSAKVAQELFGYDMNGDYSFAYYTDTAKYRGDFVQIKTKDEAIMCTLAADTLELINIDYDFIPKGQSTDTEQSFKDIPPDVRPTADKIATMFDTNASDIQFAGGGGGHGLMWNVYSITAKNGMLINFGVLNGELYAVSVYPSKASMQEFVYFDADVQLDPSIVYLASPQDFKEGEPGKGDMTRDEAQDMYMSFLNLSNGAGDYEAPAMTFYIDNSGARENYWHLESKKLKMDIASKSKWIVSLTCDNLWNPEHDLTGIKYASMGGPGYEVYVRNIMSGIYGDEALKDVSVNAVADYHYCTEDAWMADGTVYEFMFEDGKLTEVQYFYDSERFRNCHLGWKADSEYINTTTGEQFSPQ